MILTVREAEGHLGVVRGQTGLEWREERDGDGG